MSIHRYVLHNGRIREASDGGLFPGQLGLLAGWGVFSTLRVKDRALFAWEWHWDRLSRDARLLNVAMPPDVDSVERDLIRLVDSNEAPDCTLRLVIVRNGGGLWEGPASGRESDVIALTAGLKKWGNSVRLGVQSNARHAASDFARAKMLSWAPNLRWFERAHEQGLDEVILLNEFGNVAECTSANVFAVIGDRVFTPPLADGCLPGITREVLLDEIHLPGIEISERSLTVEELQGADEVFITSTTRGLLRVREIAGRNLDGEDKVRERLSGAFQIYLENDIARRKRTPVVA
jgi:branched-chain amino acid aminotransferase